MSFFISEAVAETAVAGAAAGPSMMGQLLMLGGFVLIFYFIIWRPQSQRAKAHKELVGGITKGDEVVTSGGILGKVTKVSDEFVTLQVADNVELNFQKVAIGAALPKGTIKAI
ncbi:preprotein translocase subunit YajC [Aestuariirhabdus sp. LZHN29]|uniref:preprotein translocase subunit YajC n=1 Tax=Aestuariirhabdus sp. LZHN29 TaxID=3417462 RepID=UPI003CF9A4DE